MTTLEQDLIRRRKERKERLILLQEIDKEVIEKLKEESKRGTEDTEDAGQDKDDE